MARKALLSKEEVEKVVKEANTSGWSLADAAEKNSVKKVSKQVLYTNIRKYGLKLASTRAYGKVAEEVAVEVAPEVVVPKKSSKK